jgi:uridine kinase
MTRSELIAKKINIQIQEWSQNNEKLVVAIDGYAGSGKTTIADFIGVQNSNVLVVHLDDFIKHWKTRKLLMKHAVNKSNVFEYEWYRYLEVEKLIRNFKRRKQGVIKLKTYNFDKNNFDPKRAFDLSKKILVIDGVFLMHPKHNVSTLCNKTIYLDVEFETADKKRIAREKKRWGEHYLPEDHPDNWIQYFKIAYRAYINKYKPEKHADLVFRID